MATKLNFGGGEVNLSQRVKPDDGQIKRANEPTQIKTTVIRAVPVRPKPTED